MEIYDISRVTFKGDVIDLTYMWRYFEFRHRISVGPKGYQNGRRFYDVAASTVTTWNEKSSHNHFMFYDESSIITILNKNWSRIDFITYHWSGWKNELKLFFLSITSGQPEIEPSTS
jgi:hypothetical protein